MELEQVFARAYPAEARCRETYYYVAKVSSNPTLEQQREAEGEIYLRIPYDGYGCFGPNAWQDVKHQLGDAEPPSRLNALIGHLGLQNYQDTDLDRVLHLADNNDVIPVTIPLLGGDLTDLEQLRADRLECHISQKYTPQPPEVYPVQVEAALLDEEGLEEHKTSTGSDEENLVNQLAKRLSLKRTLELKLDLQLHVPAKLIKDQLSPRIRQANLYWPHSISYRDIEIDIRDKDDDNSVRSHLAYYPEVGQLRWQDVPLQDAGEVPETELHRYTMPTSCLYFPQSSDLYHSDKLQVSFEIEAPGIVLSGVEPIYFSTSGMRLMKQFVALSTIIKVRMEISLKDCLKMRTITPYRHLHFEGVILDDMRREDIATILRDHGFDIVKATNPARESDEEEYCYLVVGEKQEHGSTLKLWVRADGSYTKTLRKTEIPDGQSFTTPVATGSIKVFMYGQSRGKSDDLTAIMNDIQVSLKQRMRHDSTLE